MTKAIRKQKVGENLGSSSGYRVIQRWKKVRKKKIKNLWEATCV